MKNFFRYFKAQSKRFAMAYPKVLCLVLITVLCIGTVAFFVFSSDDEESVASRQKVKVGIVGNLEDTYLDLAVFALQNMDSSKNYADMITMELDEAKKKLDSGEIIGYVTVPEGYVESVINGEDELLTYVIKDTAATFVPQLMNEVIETVSHYVTCSENGIYGYTDLCRAHDIPRDEYRPRADEMSFEYLDIILARESSTKTEYIGDINGFDLKGYYTCAFFCLIIMLQGLSFAPLLIKQKMALPKLLSLRNTGSVSQVLGEYIPFFALQLLNCLLMLLAFHIATEYGSVFSDLPVSTQPVVLLFARLIPAVLVMTCMQFFLYELCTGVISGLLLSLVSTIALSFVTGFFFPVSSLPESVSAFSSFLPTGTAFSYVLSVFYSKEGYRELAAVLATGAVLLLVSCIVRRAMIRSVSR